MRIRLYERLEDFPGGPLNFSVWLAAVGLVAVMLTGRATHVEYVGIARAIDHEVSAAAPCTISRVAVDLYQSVEVGDLIAVLDDSQVAAELEIAAVELRALEAQLAGDVGMGAVSGAALDWYSERRRFEIDVEDRRLEELGLTVAIESDRIEQQRLTAKMSRLEPLYADGAITIDEYEDTKYLLAVVKRRLIENLALVAKTREELAAAESRRDAFVGTAPDNEDGTPTGEPARNQPSAYLATLRAAIDVQTARVAVAKARRAALTLVAPVAGTVAMIAASSGQSVDVGEPIVVIARPHTGDVVAWLPERDARTLAAGQKVWLRSANRFGVLSESYVLRVAPSVAALPERLWRNTGTPEYGRAVMVAAADGLALLPGETIRVRFVD
jgi:HlyD family secretion protein